MPKRREEFWACTPVGDTSQGHISDLLVTRKGSKEVRRMTLLDVPLLLEKLDLECRRRMERTAIIQDDSGPNAQSSDQHVPHHPANLSKLLVRLSVLAGKRLARALTVVY